MNFSYSGGTDQQRRWVQDALAQCSYPLAALTANVTVQWSSSLPVSGDLGHAHSYMVTQTAGAGAFTITIASWADDPTNPDNLGLPNPSQDIYDFYKQSFVHELGHVVHFTLINTDALRQRAAGLFWITDVTGGSGRRSGVLADWSSGVWPDNLMEAVAEVFKCTFYSGRMIFMNRTAWRIDENPFNDLVKLIAPLGTGAFYDDFSVDHLALYGGGPPTAVTGGQLVVGYPNATLLEPSVLATNGAMSVKIAARDAVAGQAPTVVLATSVLGVPTEEAEAVLDLNIVDGAPFDNALHLIVATGAGSSDVWLHSPALPAWLVLRLTDALATAELWLTDPVLGGSPTGTAFVSRVGPVQLAQSLLIGSPVNTGTGPAGVGTLTLDDWRWGQSGPSNLTAPYPFGPVRGSIQVGAGRRAQHVVGV